MEGQATGENIGQTVQGFYEPCVLVPALKWLVSE
jgi:hypothetical protein